MIFIPYIAFLLGLVLGMITEGLIRNKYKPPTPKDIVEHFMNIEFPQLMVPNPKFVNNGPSINPDPHGNLIRKITVDGVLDVTTADSDVAYNRLRALETNPANNGKHLIYYENDIPKADIIIDASNL